MISSRISRRNVTIGTLLCCLLAAAPVSAAEQASDVTFSEEDLTFFARDVEPILQTHCYKCHGNGKSKGGLSFYERSGLLSGGDSGPAVDLETPAASVLLEAVRYESYEMPPSGKLPDEQIAIIAKWVERGAPMPPRADAIKVAHGVPQVDEETKNHWSFRPVTRPAPPEPERDDWGTNPIDAFILARLEAAGLEPNPPADRRALMRRVHYDLLGLPPSSEEVEKFANDPDPQAYEKLVDRLLESPHHGEHWARYWLDLVRYAESNSFERDNPKPFVWRYRDYVIRSLNDDKPYDQFVREQLAGDELDEVTRDSMIATGYYRLGQWDDEPADPLLARYDELDDIVATTAQAFLGLTMNCARCHDHKLDPIPQADYYRFVAFFQNTNRYGLRSEDSVAKWSLRSIATPEEAAADAARLAEHQKKIDEIAAKIDALDQRALKQLQGGERDDYQDASVRENILRRHVGDWLTKEEFEQYRSRRRERTQLERNPPKSGALALCITEDGTQAPETHLLVRGNPHVPGDVVTPGFPAVLSPPEPVIEPAANSCGRRRALADWIASPENPLTARVLVNRLWQWHFGRGIVRSSSNFGLQGDAPTHPELLDWLAAEFVEGGWTLKRMHRLILLSSTYQMSSTPNPAALAQDPENNLFWRVDMRRLRAEEIRDSILAVNGSLNLKDRFGPSIYPVIPAAVLAGQSRPGQGWGNSSLEDRRRRSIYIHIKRSLTVPLLAAFDVAETDFSCPVRFATTQPTQALGMLNSDFLNEQAQVFAEHLQKTVGSNPSAQVKLALSRTLQRSPTEAEIARGVDLMATLQQEHGQTKEAALKNFCLVALNLNEFIYLD